jgi:Zn-dependent protease with chaperone function
MSSEQRHEALIARLEVQAQETPGLYRFKLALLAALGFAVLGGSAMLAFGLSAGLVAALIAISPLLLVKLIKVVWIPIAFGWMILRALWIRFDPPEGHRLGPGEAPALQAEVERLRRITGAPRLEAIVIDGEMNAGAASMPRALGLLGNRHYLVLGLPILQALDRDQICAVIAHEFGHFGGGHSRFAGWIYRLRVGWMRVLVGLAANRAMLAGVFTRFFRWYTPYFNAYSFALARDNEYEADAIAARVVGAPAVAQALIRSDLCSARLQRDFWPRLERRVAAAAQPPQTLFRDIAAALRTAAAEDDARLQTALARRADYDDTHPTLAQRLAALGVPARLDAPPRETAAEALLGPLLPVLEQRFSAQWSEGVAPTWEARHRSLGEGAVRFAALEAQPVRDAQESLEYARLLEEQRPDDDALPAWRTALALVPDDGWANYRVGALELAAGDAAGVERLWRAMERDPEVVVPACETLHAHYQAIGDRAGRARVEDTLERLFGRHAQALQARSELRARKDELMPHGLDADALASLREALIAFGRIGHAWLVRQRIDDPDPAAPPHFVMLVYFRGFVLDEERLLQRLIERIELPGTLIAFTSSGNRGMAGRVKAVARAPVYG